MNCSPSTTLAGILVDSFIAPPFSLSLQREGLKALFLCLLEFLTTGTLGGWLKLVPKLLAAYFGTIIMDRPTAGREGFSLEDLRETIRMFIEERDWEQFHSPKNLAMALSVEVAEIVEHFQWLTEEQSQNLPPERLAEVREEIGDVMIYLTELADKLGIDPVEAARAKLGVNVRKYPTTLVKGKAAKYTEYR